MEQISSQKRINRPSDDPAGTRVVFDCRDTRSSIEQYKRNLDSAKGWVSATESTLGSIRDILVNAREIAVEHGSANSSTDTRKVAASTVQQLIDEIRGLANSQYNGRYIFAGSRTDTEPFSEAARASTSLGTAQSANGNSFDGAVTIGGAYTGSDNRTFAVRVTAGGALGTAVCDISSDGGRTWGTTAQTIPAGGTIALGNGVTLTFADTGSNRLATDDIFYVQAQAAGTYNGNGEAIAINIGKNTTFDYNISGESVFTDQGEGTTDLFQVLKDLKTALENNDAESIRNAITGLTSASNSVNLHVSECGTKANRLDIATSNMAALDLEVTQLLSNTEDADIAEVTMNYRQKELALQASYQIAASIGKTTILQFLT
jgi:flagellar hook-associated protein 3 FlgL